MSTTTIRIMYRGECPKLTSRGQGVLSYEFGVNGEMFIRITANSQGGTCSFEWIPLKTVASKSNFTLSTKPIESGQGNNGLHFRAAAFLTLRLVIHRRSK